MQPLALLPLQLRVDFVTSRFSRVWMKCPVVLVQYLPMDPYPSYQKTTSFARLAWLIDRARLSRWHTAGASMWPIYSARPFTWGALSCDPMPGRLHVTNYPIYSTYCLPTLHRNQYWSYELQSPYSITILLLSYLLLVFRNTTTQYTTLPSYARS